MFGQFKRVSVGSQTVSESDAAAFGIMASLPFCQKVLVFQEKMWVGETTLPMDP